MDRSGGANTFRIVNIGAGEGYYAVGFARRAKRGQEIIAFERDENGRQLMRDLSKRNHIVNLTIHGQCGIDELNSVLSSCGQTLVICDVEGFEMELLDPVRVEGLAKAWILVELHDFLRAGTSEVICRRVAPTHNIQKTASGGVISQLSGRSQPCCLAEWRSVQWMKAEGRRCHGSRCNRSNSAKRQIERRFGRSYALRPSHVSQP